MAMWDKLFKKKDEDSTKLNPIVQKQPMPAAPARVSAAKPVVKVQPLPPPPPPPPKVVEKAPPPEPPKPERETKNRKKPEETKSRRPSDAESFLKRGLTRQSAREHDSAIEDFTKAIELDGNLSKAYAARGVSPRPRGTATAPRRTTRSPSRSRS